MAVLLHLGEHGGSAFGRQRTANSAREEGKSVTASSGAMFVHHLLRLLNIREQS